MIDVTGWIVLSVCAARGTREFELFLLVCYAGCWCDEKKYLEQNV